MTRFGHAGPLAAAILAAWPAASSNAGDVAIAAPASTATADPPEAFSALGVSVSIHGGRLLAGVPGLDADGLANVGGAVLFESDVDEQGLMQWSVGELLRPSVFGEGHEAGACVRLGDGIMVIGSPDRSDLPGGGAPRVAVLVEADGGWTETATLTHPLATAGGGFGAAIDLDGTTVVVGAARLDVAERRDEGRVFVFELDGDGTVLDAVVIPHPDPNAFDRFGASVAIDGDRIAVGCPGDDDSATDAGSIWTFVRGDGGWITESRVEAEVGPDAGYGASVSLDGDLLAGGAPDAAGDGMVVIHRRDPKLGWTLDAMLTGIGPSGGPRDTGHAVHIAGGRLAIGQPGTRVDGQLVGTMAIWTRSEDGVWTPEGGLTPGSPGLIALGSSVSIDADLVASGMPLYSSDEMHTGGVASVDLRRDCDADGVPDLFAIAGGDVEDLNLNAIPDSCEEELVFDVPGTFPTVGDAIDAAPDGAVVEIEPGVYPTSLTLGGAAITIRGNEDPFAPTILRGVEPLGPTAGPIVRIDGPRGSACRLELLVLEAGVHGASLPEAPGLTGGGGLLVVDADPVLDRLVIRECAAGLGGGACFVRSSATLLDCTLEGNVATEAGGGLASLDGHLVIDGGRFAGNTGGGFGGAIAVRGGTATLDGVDLLGNVADAGGGLHAAPSPDSAPVQASRLLVSENVAQTRGGGLEAASDGPGIDLFLSIVCDNLPDEIAGPIAVDADSEVCQCPGDLSGDGLVNGADLGLLLAAFGACPDGCAADIDGNGLVNGGDLGLLLAGWGICP